MSNTRYPGFGGELTIKKKDKVIIMMILNDLRNRRLEDNDEKDTRCLRRDKAVVPNALAGPHTQRKKQ